MGTFRKLNQIKTGLDSNVSLLEKDQMISYLESQVETFKTLLHEQQQKSSLMQIEQEGENKKSIISNNFEENQPEIEFEKIEKKKRIDNLLQELAQFEENLK